MRKTLVIFLSLIAWTAQAKEYAYYSVPNDPMNGRIYTLDNGLTVFLSRNTQKPEIQTFIAVRAGAQNDPLESTGLAHYQEHIMFKGTTHYGTTDYEAEQVYLTQIDSLYDIYGRTSDAAIRKAIYHQIDSVSYLSSQVAIANEFDKLMSIIGAKGVNAFTSTDMTCYHEIIPAGELRRWAMIESNRFQNLVIRGFHTELEAVYEEFNMYSTMDQDKVMQAANNILYPQVPYRQHSVIGTQEHLKNPSLTNIRRFYQTYYRPNNVAVCLSGDLDYDHTIAIVDEYFGQWQPNNNLPKTVIPVQPSLSAPRDTIVYGKETPELWLAWSMPAVQDEDRNAIEVMSQVLQNGKCGLMDLDIDQKQLLLASATGVMPGNDYSTFFAIGYPKAGQSLEQTRAILLAEVEKLKKGDFSEDLLQAIIANSRRDEMESLDDNTNRVFSYVNSFIYGIPYDQVVHQVDAMAKITKDDVVRVANKYLGNNYAAIYKQQKEDANPSSVDKPAITPIEMNRDKSSSFVTNLAQIEPEALQPQFLDFDKDLSRTNLKGDQQLLYKQNTDNELFYLTLTVAKGKDADPVIDLATDLIEYLGTQTMGADEYETALYSLAAEVDIYNTHSHTIFSVSGLQENFAKTLALLEDKVLDYQPNDAILKELIKDNIKAHHDAKSNQGACFSQLMTAGQIGLKANAAATLTPKQMKKMSAAEVMNHVKSLIPGIATVTYYGPATQDEVAQTLNTQSRMIAMGNKDQQYAITRLQPELITQPEVWIAPYKANNIYLFQFANWGDKYSPRNEAIATLFNEYFDGSMGSIVFQEMRESRALCYASAAEYSVAEYAGENNVFFTYIISQNDKLKDCLQAFDSICTIMPLSQSAFEQAQNGLIKRIEKRRYVGQEVLNAYVRYIYKGWNHDYTRDIYEASKTFTLDDVVSFQQNNVANRTYRYLILGDPKSLDMNFLKSLGTVKQLTLKDIFVY